MTTEARAYAIGCQYARDWMATDETPIGNTRENYAALVRAGDMSRDGRWQHAFRLGLVRTLRNTER